MNSASVFFLLAALTGIPVSAPVAPSALPPGLSLARTDLLSPAAKGSQCSNLFTAPDGTIHLTWCEPGTRESERALRHSTLAPGASAWSKPTTIVSSGALMENWADFASLVVGRDGTLSAQWFQKPADGNAHGYSGWFSRSTDAGVSWSTPTALGQEFVSLAPLSNGRVLSVWLEHIPGDRKTRLPGAPSMKLASKLLDASGKTLGEWTIDPDVCSCCQTTLAVLANDQVFVAYRGHTSTEIRDHHVALFSGMSWSAPRSLHDDGWKIAGCPVNGPAADAHGNALAVTWFTAANGVARLQAKYSTDGGAHFSPAVGIDAGNPMGRTDLALLNDGSALITWMEAKSNTQEAGIYARRLWTDGTLSAPSVLALSSQARTSGFPRVAIRPDGTAVLAFTQVEGQTHVRTLAFYPSELQRGTQSGLTQRAKRISTPVELCESPALASNATGVARVHTARENSPTLRPDRTQPEG